MDVILFSGLYHMLKHGVTAGFFCAIAVLACFKSFLRINPQKLWEKKGFSAPYFREILKILLILEKGHSK